MKKLVSDLNYLYRREPALHELDFEGNGFEWIDCHNYSESTFTYIRKAKNPADFVVVGCNFTPVPRPKHRIGVPHAGWYQEIFNSDSLHYAGSNMGNFPGVEAEGVSSHGRPATIEVTLPPLGAVVFKPKPV